MGWHLVPLTSVAAIPWRNGGGVTRELLAWPRAGDWQVRVSVADIAADGPFSHFPGIERWFAVLEGDGVRLHIEGQATDVLADGSPLRFPGAAAVDCELRTGPTRDFNLMAPPGRARLARVGTSLAGRTAAPMLVAAYSHAAAATLRLDGAALALPAATLAWRSLAHPAHWSLEGAGALWMEMQP